MATDNEIPDTDGADDLSAALAEMSEGLFGEPGSGSGKPEEAESEASSGEGGQTPAVVSGDEAVETAPLQENAAAVADVGAPKTWTKDAIADWATIPARAQQEILKREEDMFRGLEEYKGAAALGKSYDAVVEPYRAALAAEGVDPVQLFNSFATNHWLLSRGTPEQKMSIVTNLIKGYGIDIDALSNNFANQPYVDPTITALESRIAAFEQREQNQNRASEQARSQEVQSSVAAFAADPANTYFEQVADLIPGLLKGGMAKTLPEAYEQAIMLNPTTRAAEMARLQAEATAATAKVDAEKLTQARAASAGNVRTIAKAKDGTVPVGTIDDTMEETMAKIRARS